MSESRKNHLNIDGAQVKEDDRVDFYKPIPETDQEFRSSKASFGKSKEKVSDPAAEKLLTKEDEAKIVTRVDMPAEAKYVVGDHRNGDAKIELDANKRQFSGLTKEELLKYADDPFWVRLRWFMFVLFWALWVAMLAGAIAIIIRAPKCAPPTPKTWYEVGPLVDHYTEAAPNYSALEAELEKLQKAEVPGIFINPCAETYEVLDSASTCIEDFKKFLDKAKKSSIKVIVDLTANFVSTAHNWFELSVNRSEGFADYFVWADASGYNGDAPTPPNNWVSLYDKPAWTWNEKRRQFYLHQYGSEQADLNFHQTAVVSQFDQVLTTWLAAGADGVRLRKVRQLLVNVSALRVDELMIHEPSAVVGQYGFLKHTLTADQPALDGLLARWAGIVAGSGDEKVFTVHEDGRLQPEWYRLRNSTLLRPPSAAPLQLGRNVTALAAQLHRYSDNWTALQLTAEDEETSVELRALTTLLPVTPLLTPAQLDSAPSPHNHTAHISSLSHLFGLRNDPSVKFGARAIAAVPAVNSTAKLIAVARWKAGGIAYVCVFNPSAETERANLTYLPSLPATLGVAYLSDSARLVTNYTTATTLNRDDVSVPGRSSVVLSYVPNTAAEQ